MQHSEVLRSFGSDDEFSSPNSSLQKEAADDNESVMWAALERLPTYDRVRKAILVEHDPEDGRPCKKQVDVSTLQVQQRQKILNRLIEEDNESLLIKLRDRIDRVAIELPRIEVRVEQLNVEAQVYVGSRALPTLVNVVQNFAEACFNALHLSSSKRRTLTVLQNASTIIKPSRMTLLLGPPGSGKTTLLLALAGKLDRTLQVTGRVTYNGHEMSEFVPQRTSAYISQVDLQNAEMTVRETIDFSGCCQGIGSRYELLSELTRREKAMGIRPDHDIDIFMKATSLRGQRTSIMTDYVMKILDLEMCSDVIVGDAMRRGISGGQKKRVTTGEMLVGPAKALFMDEISTGLDSSTTFQIISCLRRFVHLMDSTMLISLLQPAPETFELFDDIILLSEGRIVYQGPREMVLEFFETQGFRCPERKGVADFLQEVTSRKDQAQYWAGRQAYRYVSVDEFHKAFERYHLGQKLAEELSKPFDKTASHPAALVTEKFALNNWELFRACLAKEFLLMKRNSFVYVFGIFQILVIASITMTVFLRTSMKHQTIHDGIVYLGAMFFALLNSMFNGFADLALTITRLPVFYKQRDLLFFPAWAYSLPMIITKLPISLAETGAWVFLTYWTMGFAPEWSRFFGQLLIFFCTNQMAQSLFRLTAAVGRTMIIANTFGSFAILIIICLGGFIINREDVHPWWLWGYWMSPLMYGQNAIAVNEFRASRWAKPSNVSHTVGEAVLRSHGLFTQKYWYWIGVGGLAGFAVLFNTGFVLAMTYLNPVGKPQAIVSEEVLEKRDSKSFSNGIADEGIEMQCKVDIPRRGMVLPFQPLSLAFHHVNYFVEMPAEMKQQGVTGERLQLLRDVSGVFRPSVLTALVGVSGAGKTTLMDVLAGRKTGGYIEGDITISGHPKNQETFARVSGYCEQNDIHSPNVTVEESLLFSACLRLSEDIDRASKMMFVEEVMELVELTSLRNALVGLPGVTGLSVEQRKRLTVAVELVANPSIIFMDEPTSGLDARAAAIVMRTVRNTVNTGRTVVCTIHQPSIDIFEAFDELLLMKRGGEVIYAGPLGKCSLSMIEYFEAIPGVPRYMQGYNPATWMLEVTSQVSESRLAVDFADVYRNSPLYSKNEALIQDVSHPSEKLPELHFATKYSQPFFTQLSICLWKHHLSYWRNPDYCVIRMFFTAVSAVLFGAIFFGLGMRRSKQQDLFNLMGVLYSGVVFLGANNSWGIQPVVAAERIAFYRERAAGLYSALAYAIAQMLIEVPYTLVQTLVYGIIIYSMIGFEWTAVKVIYFFFFCFCGLFYYTLYGMMTVALTPNEQVAAIVSAFFFGIWNLFAGFLIPYKRIPIWWRWYYWANPVSWTIYGLFASQLGDVNTVIEIPDEPVKTVRQFMEEYFNFKHEFLGVVASMNVVFVLLFAFVFAYAIKYLNFQKR